MATNGKNDQRSFIYLGLAGETGRGREVHSGLYRLADGSDEWQPMHAGLPDAPAIRALAVHPAASRDRLCRHAVRAVSQQRSRRALGEGGHRRPRPAGLVDPVPPARSRRDVHRLRELRDPSQRRCRRALDAPAGQRALPGDHHRTRRQSGQARADAGRQRQRSPTTCMPPIEVGGTLRSTDGGEHWENLSHGQYLNDDAVDMHGVLVSRWRPGTVIGIGRAGMFHSVDGGDHWRHVPLDAMNPKGQIYCRDIREVPGNPRKVFVAAGAGFQSDAGALLYSGDGGDTWSRVDHGREAAAHDVRARVRRTPAGADVLRHQWRRGLQQPRRRRELDRASAAARRHADLRPGPRADGFRAHPGPAATCSNVAWSWPPTSPPAQPSTTATHRIRPRTTTVSARKGSSNSPSARSGAAPAPASSTTRSPMRRWARAARPPRWRSTCTPPSSCRCCRAPRSAAPRRS